MATRVFVDANVLYSRTLLDWLALLQLRGGGGIYTVYWTEDVLAEVLYRLRRNNPKWDGGRITRIRDLITGTFEGGRVEDFLVDGSFPGTDVDDQHVHAAALACEAEIVLTADHGFAGAGFDGDKLPYEVYQPDDFFLLVHDTAPDLVQAVTREQAEYSMNKHGNANVAGALENAGCPKFGAQVRVYQLQLSLQPAETSENSGA